jgi:histidine triad (HIT) family protein
MPTIFSKIVTREIPAHIVYEDEVVIAFLDIMQATKGHTLVATKHPYENINAVPEDVAAHLFMIAKRIAKALNHAFDPDGLNVLSNNGAAAGQQVFHFHVHLIPRYFNDDATIKLKNHTHETLAEDYVDRKKSIIEALTKY